MPNTDGYTKAAQKKKFVRNRDIKLSQGEVKYEGKIQKGMSEGVCKRCRDKVQWRFQYNKYKPLKQPATCQQCRQKSITKAYRTLCDSCAKTRGVCPSCCESHDNSGNTQNPEKASKPQPGVASSVSDTNTQNSDMDLEDEVSENACTIGAPSVSAASSTVGSIERGRGDEGDYGTYTGAMQAEASWDAKKFESFAHAKYSKSRVVGSEGDVDVTAAQI
jgi:hypothetical protein